MHQHFVLFSCFAPYTFGLLKSCCRIPRTRNIPKTNCFFIEIPLMVNAAMTLIDKDNINNLWQHWFSVKFADPSRISQWQMGKSQYFYLQVCVPHANPRWFRDTPHRTAWGVTWKPALVSLHIHRRWSQLINTKIKQMIDRLSFI